MTDGTPRPPGSRSERHQRRRKTGGRTTDGSAPPRTPHTLPSRSSTAPGTATRGAVVPPPVIEPLRPEPPRRARRSGQRADRRVRRRRILTVVGSALGVVLLVVAAVFAVDRLRGDAKGEGTKPRTQRTVLLQIPADDGTAQVGALIATDPETGRAAVMLLPSRVLTEVPGHGDTTFGRALALGGADLSRDTLANLMGVIVDGTWTLTAPGLQAMVDEVGGVIVDVDADVTRKDKDGVTEVLLKAGAQQTLDGESAVRFATFVAPDEQELARLPRLQAVLEGLVERLPKTAPAVSALLPGTAGSVASVPPATLAEQLMALADARRREAMSPAVLPVSEVDAGGEQVTYRLEQVELDNLVQKDFAGSVPENPFGSKNRVLIRNGVGTAGLGQSVTRKLLPAGFRVVGTGNAPTFDHEKTVVLVFDSADEDVELGQRVAEVLGVSDDAVQLSDIDQTVADVIVIIGRDYKP